MDAIEAGARQAVLNCASVKSGENVVIVTDRATRHLADALLRQAEGVGAKVTLFVMEEYGPRPTDGVNPIKFPAQIGEALAKAQVSFYIAAGKSGELASFRKPMLLVVEKNHVRHGHMPGFTEEMMSQGMASDYRVIQEISKKVYDIVSKAAEIRVTTKNGTDVTAKFSPKRKWIVADGRVTKEKWTNLPDGEVFTSPVTADGPVVIDGCLGDFFTEKYGDLGKTPLRYELKDGRAVAGSVSCANDALKKEFEKYTFHTDENSMRVGEFAIGTNIGLKKLIGNLLQDEKFPGVHIALGDPYPDQTGADYSSKAHNDGVMRNPTITVDGRVIMKEGQFTL
ncbi:MAG: aminopeptidase [Pseudomonadota bacterium]